jgi:hypothetical protein
MVEQFGVIDPEADADGQKNEMATVGRSQEPLY